jgi:hypothetical protein
MMYTKSSVVALFCATLATAQSLFPTDLTPAQVRNIARDHDERRLTFN